jgi:hypothetical protein
VLACFYWVDDADTTKEIEQNEAWSRTGCDP